MNINFVCNRTWIFQDVPLQLWEAQTSDGQANTLITRFLHNKPLFYFDNFARCYLSYLSPDFVSAAFTLIGLLFFIVGLYNIVLKKKRLLIFVLLLGPLFPLLEVPSAKLYQGILLYTAEATVILYGIFCSIRGFRKHF